MSKSHVGIKRRLFAGVRKERSRTVEARPRVDLQRVVVLDAAGAMGAGSAALFPSGGCDVLLFARDLGKCEGAPTAIHGIAKLEQIASSISAMTYSDGLDLALAGSDLIFFECLAEDLELKREMLAALDRARPPEALATTVSSGLSIPGMAEGLSGGGGRGMPRPYGPRATAHGSRVACRVRSVIHRCSAPARR